MKILILGINYLPESTGIAPYTADLAEHLVKAGHKVKIVTGFPWYPQWRIWDGYQGKLFQKELINEVEVFRTFLYIPKNPRRALARILFDTWFAISALVAGLRVGKYDLVVAVSPPLQIGLTAWILAKLRRVPFFLQIKDLVPDAALATGQLNEKSIAVRIARKLEQFVYNRAGGIGVICNGFQRNLQKKGVVTSKIELLPDYIDLKFIQPVEKFNSFRHKHNIEPDKFLVLYSGSVALKQGLHTLIETASKLVQEKNIVFYLIGEGPYLEELKQLAGQHSLTNMHFLPLQPREGLAEQLGAADVLLITQRKTVTDIVFPGKLLYYMGAARPILAAVNAQSETGTFIEDNSIGLTVPPEDASALAEAILQLYQDKLKTRELGDNGRKLVEQRFDREIVLEQFAYYFAKFENPPTFSKRAILLEFINSILHPLNSKM
jgi:colanic acid biosynthesis glycosyl transferase WcaI